MNIKKTKIDEAYILIKKRKNHLSNYFYLSKKGDLNEATKNLYSCLRKIKNKGYKWAEGLSQRTNHWWAKGKVRDKIAVHNIKVEPVKPTVNGFLARLSKVCKVCS